MEKCGTVVPQSIFQTQHPKNNDKQRSKTQKTGHTSRKTLAVRRLPRDIARDIAAGFCGGRWRGGGLAPGGGGLDAPSPSPGPPSPPSPCAVAPRRSRSRSVARPSSPLPSQLVTCWLRSLCRSRFFLTVRYVLLPWHPMAGSAPMRRGLVLVRSFFMPPAVPAHPSTQKPHAGGKALEACPQGATPYGEPHAGRHSKALPPALRGERCAPPTAARSLFVRCRPLLGGVRWAARGKLAESVRFDVCPCAWALFWLGHFLLPMLRPPTKPQCGGQCGGRSPCGQGRTFWGPNFPKICP